MHTFSIEKAFLPSLTHNDVFACHGSERLIQTIEIVKKVLLSGKHLRITRRKTGRCRD